MATEIAKRLTAEEFLHWPEEEGHELIDGQPVENKEMGAFSCTVAGWIFHLLVVWNNDAKHGVPIPKEVGYRIFPDDEDRIRKPDVSFIPNDRLLSDEIPTGWITAVPSLVVEVISPSETWSVTAGKIKDYLSAGVSVIWVVDPELRQVQVRRANEAPIVLRETDVLQDEELLPGFACRVKELFTVLARR